MKAMLLTGPRELRLGEIEKPEPANGEVLVRLTSSGICGTDLKIFEGAIPVPYPLVMGHEMIGVLVEGGDDEIKNGERVIIDPALYCGRCVNCRAGQTSLCPKGVLLGRDKNGGFAEFMAVPRSNVYKLPDSIDNQAAPILQMATTCLHAHRAIGAFLGQSVVVVGLGMTGLIHMQLAKAWGAHPVIGVELSPWRRSVAMELGADIVLPAKAEGVKGVLDATGGIGADLVIESTGVMAAIADAIAMARLGATVLNFGISSATQGSLPFYQFYYKELKFVNSRAAKPEDFPVCIDLVARGVLNLKRLATHVVPLVDLEKAIAMLVADSEADRRIKVILEHAL